VYVRYFDAKMFSGRRPGKRSIVGTRVCARFAGGFYQPGVISAIQTAAPWEAAVVDRYMVEFDDGSRQTFDGVDIVGSGFQTVTRDRLGVGQTVFITHNGREVEGSIEQVNSGDDVVMVSLMDNSCSSVLVAVRTEDVRLLKSRRSARLSDSQQAADVAGSSMMPVVDCSFDGYKQIRYKEANAAAAAGVSHSWPYNHWHSRYCLLEC